MRKIDAQVSVLADDGKTYQIAFRAGEIVAAASPLPNDSVTRVALTSHLVSSMQVGEITRRLAAESDRDEVDIVASVGKLSADQTAILRRRLTIQRAARTFAIDRATFEIHDAVTLPVVPGFTVPIGAVIFHGVRMNLSEQRLVEDLREIGSTYIMRPTTTDPEIASYGFEGDIRSVVNALRIGTTLAELELASHRDLEPRTLHAMLYALVCGMHCDASGGQHVDRTAPPLPRTSTGLVTNTTVIKVDEPLVARSRTTMSPATVSRAASTMPPVNMTRTISSRTLTPEIPTRDSSPAVDGARFREPTDSPPTVSRTATPRPTTSPTLDPAVPRTATPRPTSSPPFDSTASRTMTPRPTTTPPLDRSRAGSNPPVNVPRAPTNPGTFGTTRTPAGTAQPPLRSATMPPPRHQTQTSSPLDEFIKETTTNRGFTSIEELTQNRGTGNHRVVDDFKNEPSTNRGLPATIPPAVPRTITTPRTITERDRAKKEIEALIATRIAKLEQGVDYFTILGLPFEAPLDAVRNAYVETSRRLHPDSLSQLEILDEQKFAPRILAQISAAFNVLTDTSKRRDYLNGQKRGDPTPIAPRARTGELDKAELAAEAFEAGEGALKRDDIPRAVEELGRACTLAPTNLEYMALFAWAQFCAAHDKQKIYVETRKMLEKAIHRGEKPVVARFYLGRVERMVGHDREAMNHFQEVLLDEPNHREAASEVRVLEQKMARGSTKPKR